MKPLLIILLMISSLCAAGTPSGYRLTLTGADREGNKHSIEFGTDSAATYGYDNQLGESPVPPSPPDGIFDFRFKDLPDRRRIPSDGSYKDLRPALNAAQCDTFIVYCQASHGTYPMTIRLAGDYEQSTDSIAVETVPASSERIADLKRVKKFFAVSESKNTFRIIVFSRQRADSAR